MAPARIAHGHGNQFLTRRAHPPGHVIAAIVVPRDGGEAGGCPFEPNEDLAMSTVSLTAANDQPSAHSFVMSLVVRAVRALERHRAVNELASLDDRMLSDIGVSRADIRLVVDGYRY
jgi:uncharacterized protein YjiS (DUF1127 family)